MGALPNPAHCSSNTDPIRRTAALSTSSSGSPSAAPSRDEPSRASVSLPAAAITSSRLSLYASATATSTCWKLGMLKRGVGG